jgi:16S rRNA (cytidine1402-2'-O)-methyltransferase
LQTSSLILSNVDKTVKLFPHAQLTSHSLSSGCKSFFILCQKNNIKYDVLPGANAALVSYVASAFDSTRFLFYGFLPHKKEARQNALKEIVNFSYPVIVYESPHRIEKFFEELGSLYPDIEIFAAKEISKLHQTYFLCKASDALQELKKISKKGEWCMVLKPTQESLFADEKIFDLFKNSNFPKKEASQILSKLFKIPQKECYKKLHHTEL